MMRKLPVKRGLSLPNRGALFGLVDINERIEAAVIAEREHQGDGADWMELLQPCGLVHLLEKAIPLRQQRPSLHVLCERWQFPSDFAIDYAHNVFKDARYRESMC